jgi:hypothetical protein
MGARRYSTEQIIVKLREAGDRDLERAVGANEGERVSSAMRQSGLHQQTRHEAHGARFARLLGLDEE